MAKTTTGRDAGQAPGASPISDSRMTSTPSGAFFAPDAVSAEDLAALMTRAGAALGTDPASERIGAGGIAAGSRIMTLDGAIAVEFLNPGDRIVTRSGMKVLRQIRAGLARGAVIRIGQGSLGHDRPEQPLLLAANTPVLVRDWRAQTLYGAVQALVPVCRLADGEMIVRIEPGHPAPDRDYDSRPAPTASELAAQNAAQPLAQPGAYGGLRAPVRLYTLQFDTPEILYADGVEVGCEALPIPLSHTEELVCPA